MIKGKVALWGMGGVLVLALVAVTTEAVGQSSLNRIAKTYGIPTSGDEIKAPCRVPEKENAYGLYVAFRDAMKAERMVAGKRGAMPSLGTSIAPGLEPFEPAKTKEYLVIYRHSLAAAEAMANRSKWFVDRDLGRPTTPSYLELANLKQAVKLLVLDAQLKLSTGDRKVALDLYVKAARIGSFANSEPNIIGDLVYIACESIVVNSFAQESPLIAKDPVTERRALKILDHIQKPDLARAIRGESYFNYYYVRNGLPPDFFRQAYDGSEESAAQSQLLLINATRSFWGPDLLKREGEIIQSAQGNDYSRFRAQSARTEKWKETSGTLQWVAGLILPTFPEVGASCERLLASRDLVRVGLSAIAEKRQPVVGGTVDSFSGKPYKLVAQPYGWRLYSVGRDGTDGGGVVDPKEPNSSKDIIFSYDGKSFLVGR